MNKFNPVSFLLFFSFFYPVLKGFLIKFSSKNIKEDIEEFTSDMALVMALFLGIYYTKNIFIQHEKGYYKDLLKYIPNAWIKYLEANPIVIYIVILPLLCYIFYKIIFLIFKFLNRISLYPIFDYIDEKVKKRSNISRRLLGALIQVPKGICFLFIMALILNLVSVFTSNKKLNYYLEDSKSYKYICKNVIVPATNSKIAKKLPEIINNSFKIEVKETVNPSKGLKAPDKQVTYYNGVTLEDGIKSNAAIDDFARSLVKNDSDTISKGRTLYKWIGSNIIYDNGKADRILNNDFAQSSGAIVTFQSRKGICFDYSCLYVAMCRANNIKVRLITGEGFNGVNWVGHAWNQIYDEDSKEWINVDTTFYKGGNYFNSRRFEFDHRDDKIAGQW